jgi:hypothetical protein
VSSPLRSILPIAGALAALVVIAVIVALVASPDEPETFAAGSPERAVQDYIEALRDFDVDRAYGMLSEQARADVSRSDFRMYVRYSCVQQSHCRVRLADVSVDGDRATVQVALEHSGGGPLDLNRYTERITIPLVREDGTWKIDDPHAFGWW